MGNGEFCWDEASNTIASDETVPFNLKQMLNFHQATPVQYCVYISIYVGVLGGQTGLYEGLLFFCEWFFNHYKEINSYFIVRAFYLTFLTTALQAKSL